MKRICNIPFKSNTQKIYTKKNDKNDQSLSCDLIPVIPVFACVRETCRERKGQNIYKVNRLHTVLGK